MTRLLRTALVFVAVLSLIAATGCGGDTKSNNAYVDQLNKVQTDFSDSITKATSAQPSGGSAQEKAQATFDSLGSSIDKLIADLKGIDAPEKVQDLHSELISEMDKFKTQVSAAAKSLSSGDPQAIVAAQTKFATEASKLGTEISQTIDGINKKLQE